MMEVIFIFEGSNIIINCDKNKKIIDACNNLCTKINMDLNLLIFLYEGKQLNLDETFNEITNENTINILAYKKEEEICLKCRRILNDKIIKEILLSNIVINNSLTGLKTHIENIITDIKNKKDINYVNNKLKNMNMIINNIMKDFKIMISKLEQNQLNNDYLINPNNKINNNIEENKINELNENKNEIICCYNKLENEINLLHDYNNEYMSKNESYIEPKKKYK